MLTIKRLFEKVTQKKPTITQYQHSPTTTARPIGLPSNLDIDLWVRWRQQGAHFEDIIGRSIFGRPCKSMEAIVVFRKNRDRHLCKRIAIAVDGLLRWLFHGQVLAII